MATIKNAGIQQVLEIQVEEALTSSSTVIFGITETEQFVIGQIQAKGFYSFPLTKEIKGILLYDAIKKKEIHKINF